MNYTFVNHIPKPFMLGAIALILSSCAAIPPETAHSSMQSAERYASADPALTLSRANWPQLNWWESYNDPQLNQLMHQAVLGTPTLEIAGLRLQQAQLAANQVFANSGANISANGTISRELESANSIYPPPYAGSWLTNSRIALDFKYEFDWWGKQRAQLKAALGEAQAVKAEQASAYLILTTSIAQSYFNYQTALARLSLAQKNINDVMRLLTLNQLRQQHGLDAITPQYQTQGSLALAQRNKAMIETSRLLAKSQLQALLGIPAQEMTALTAVALPKDKAVLPEHLGLDLVAHRPDLQAARWRVEAAFQHVEAAKAEFYPDINLTAFLGLTSVSLEQLLRAGSQTKGIAPAIHLPIFDSGRLKAQLGIRRAEAEYAIASYNKTLTDAVKDVTDQALILQGLLQQQQSMSQSLASARSLHHTADIQSKQGLVDGFGVLQAKINVNTQEDNNILLANQRLTTQVNLIRALGGGYLERLEQSLGNIGKSHTLQEHHHDSN
ncbi:MAG: efflux transporter outer membrane subunit [Pseudomonadota bacterium]